MLEVLVPLVLATVLSGEVVDNSCPKTADRPAGRHAIPAAGQRSLDPYSISQTVTDYYDAPLGLGILEATGEEGDSYYDWMFEVELPLWYAPDSTQPLGWLSQGIIYKNTGKEKLTGAGMVETEYEQTNFIVWEAEGPWLKLRLNNDLQAWTHTCHLNMAKIKLESVTWQTFLRRHADWLHFRRPVPHLLRASPSIESEHVTTIGLDHKLVLLDIRGDWMKVEVQQPDLTCVGPDQDENQATKHHGWVKWRGERGPWVYFYTRGC